MKEGDRLTAAEAWLERIAQVKGARQDEVRTSESAIGQPPETGQGSQGAPQPTERNWNMATITVFPSADNPAVNQGRSMDDLYGDPFDRELRVQQELMNRSPFNTPPTKFAEAAQAVQNKKVTHLYEAFFEVEGHKGDRYKLNMEAYTCPCPQADKTDKGRYGCYHRVAAELYRRTVQALRPLLEPALPLGPTTPDERLAADPAPQEAAPAPMPSASSVEEITAKTKRQRPLIPEKYITAIKGKRHVQFAGLVIAAQEDGLIALSADWTYNDAELSLAHAEAVFQDGRHYKESGDATPSNVTPMVKPHFRRVALTRAKARCLRDALGIEECAVEELDVETEDRHTPDMSKPPAKSQTPPPVREGKNATIVRLLKALGSTATTREDYQAVVAQWTGYDLSPAHFDAIIAELQSMQTAGKA